MLIKSSFEGFQPCSCVSTWCVVLKKCPFCGKKFSHFDIFRFSIFTFLSRNLLHFWKYEPPSFCKVSNLTRFGNMRRDNKSLDCFKILTEKFFKNLQNAFKILLPAWRKCFFRCFFWFACEFLDPIKPISVRKPAKAFFFHNASYWLSKLDWWVLWSTSSGTLICSSAGANRELVWQIHTYHWNKHAQLLRY